MKPTMLFIYNPQAGKQEILSQLHGVLDQFIKAGFWVTVRPTQYDNDAYHIVKRWGGGFDYIVCCGGDGTLNETIQGLMEMELQPKVTKPLLGYLPGGSTNDFGASLGLSTHLETSAKIVLEGRPTVIPIGQLDKRYFSYVAAFGLFTDVPYDTPQSMKNLFGHTAYLLEGVKRLGNITPHACHVQCGDEEFRDNFILGMVTNSASVGGFRLPSKVGNEGKGDFYLILLKELPHLSDYASTVATLLGRTEPGPQFIIRKVDRLTVTSPNPLPWTLDGEFGGQYTHSKFIIHPQGVTILLP